MNTTKAQWMWRARALATIAGGLLSAFGKEPAFSCGLILAIFGITTADFMPAQWRSNSERFDVLLVAFFMSMFSLRGWLSILEGQPETYHYYLAVGCMVLSAILVFGWFKQREQNSRSKTVDS